MQPSTQPQSEQSQGEIQPEMHPLERAAASMQPSTQPQSEQSQGEIQPEMHPLERAAASMQPSTQPQSEQSQGEIQPEMHPLERAAASMQPSTQPQSEQSQGEIQPEMHPPDDTRRAKAEPPDDPVRDLRARATFMTFRYVSSSSSVIVKPASLSSSAATRISREFSSGPSASGSSDNCVSPSLSRANGLMT
jgi:hypothetical protein